MKNEIKEKLRKLFEEFIELPFPHYTAGNKGLGEIIPELADLDGHIAGLVSSYLDNAPVRKKYVYIDENLNKSLSEIRPSSKEEQKALSGFVEYKRRIDEMTRILQKLLEE